MTNDEKDDEVSSTKVKFSENKGLYIKNIFRSIGLLIWNNKKKRFINRDFKSWGFLGIFYGIFYILIGGFFWAMMAILMAFVSMSGNRPLYTGLDSPLSSAAFVPGMSVKPYIGTTSQSVIAFSTSDPSTMVANLNFLYSDYETFLPNTQQCSDLGVTNGTVACSYDLPTILKDLNCSQNASFGYTAGSPCVFLKLNNLFDWIPTSVAYPPNDWLIGCNATTKLAEMKAKAMSYIYVACKGQSSSDEQNFNLTYNSPYGLDSCVGGLPFYYYPYNNVANYMQPLVVVKINANPGVDINMICNAWAGGINNDEKTGYGSVKFTVRVN